MSQMSIFKEDNAKQDILNYIQKERGYKKRMLSRNINNGESIGYPRGYLDCLDLMEHKIKKELEESE